MFHRYWISNFTQLTNLEKKLLLKIVLSGIGVLFLTWISALMQLEFKTFSQEFFYWAGLILTTPILAFSARSILRKIVPLNAFRFSIDISIFFSLFCCYLYSLFSTLFYAGNNFAFFDSILLILFILYISRYLEAYSQQRLKKKFLYPNAIFSQKVTILKPDNQRVDCAFKDIAVSDRLIIPPLEYFPVDGNVCDQAGNITLQKVKAGMRNLDKTLIIKSIHDFKNSNFEKILSALQSTQKDKPFFNNTPLALTHQMFALIFTAVIFCWWLPFDTEFAFSCAIFATLVTCPCTLAIVTPLLIAYLLEICAKQGIFIKNPLAFLKLKEVNQVLFEKTGTLTEGKLRVQKVEYCNQVLASEILPLVALVEQQIHHPVASAILQYASQQNTILPEFQIQHLQFFPGSGIRAEINGKTLLIGNAKWLIKNGIFIPLTVTEYEGNQIPCDHITVHCAFDNIEVIRFQLKDQIRIHAANVIQSLKKHNIEVNLLSGDRPDIVNEVAKQLGPISASGSIKPQAKEACIASLQDKDYITAMVGDGFNDVLALQQADVGIAMDLHDPLSVLSCDVIFKDPQLRLVANCFEISRFARKILKQNTFLALFLNWGLLPIAALGELTPMIALVTLCLSTLLIMGNTTRLQHFSLSL